MGQKIPLKHRHALGCIGAVTRRSCTFTPAAAMTLCQFSFTAQRDTTGVRLLGGVGLNEVDTMEWEIRTAIATHKPGTAANTLLASGSFDYRYTSVWKLFRPITYTVSLTSPLGLTAATEYHFILKTPSDTYNLHRPLYWLDTYVTGAGAEVDATIYCCEYYGGAWTNGDNTYNLQLTILNNQAGSVWHTVIDGNGFIQPDKMRGYRCEQVAGGIAQSRGGQSEYSQLRYPYSNLSQDNWTSSTWKICMPSSTV